MGPRKKLRVDLEEPETAPGTAELRTATDRVPDIAEQKQLRYVPGANGWTDLGDGGEAGYFPCELQSHAEDWLAKLQSEVHWQQLKVFVMGRRVKQPRLVAYQTTNEDVGTYTYARLTLPPSPMTETVDAIRKRVQQLAGTEFNSCLLNLYRSGQDHVSWHADDEPLYGEDPTIASVSLGLPRDFALRNNANPGRKIKYPLGHGDVLLMRGSVQRHWQHCILKQPKLAGHRINLTFRTVKFPEKLRSSKRQHPHQHQHQQHQQQAVCIQGEEEEENHQQRQPEVLQQRQQEQQQQQEEEEGELEEEEELDEEEEGKPEQQQQRQQQQQQQGR